MITLDNFEHLVPFKIWQRGMDYYEDGAVSALEEISPGEWTATVEGTECYTVEISLNGDEVEAWECDCPYDMGDICKHIVAVVMAIRDEKKKSNKSAFSKRMEKTVVVEKMRDEAEEVPFIEEDGSDENKPSFTDLMKLAKKEDLSSFIEAYAMNDGQFKQVFLDYLTQKYIRPEKKIQKDYCQEVMRVFVSAIKKRRSRYSYYDDYDGETRWDVIESGMQKLFNEASTLLRLGEVKGPAKIASQFFLSLSETVDDSILYDDDALCMMGDCCERAAEIMREVVKHPSASTNLKHTILNEVDKICDLDNYFDFGSNELKCEISQLIQTPEQHLAMLDEEIKMHSEYSTSRYVDMKIDYLNELGRTEEAQTVMNQYLHLPGIRRKKVEQLQGEEKYAEALELLNDGIIQAKQDNLSGTETQWLGMKLRIYELQKSNKEIIATCRTLFIANGGSMEYYKKLKKNVPSNEWKAFLFGMIAEVKYKREVIADIYEEEKEYDELLRWIISDLYNRIENILNYGLRMPKNSHSTLLDLFATDIKAYAADRYNMSRNHYQKIAQWLHEAKKITGGDLVVNRIVEEFRTMYKRRPAMMEELRGL